MGMVLAYCRVSPHNAKTLLSQPVLIHSFLGADSNGELPPSGWFDSFKRLFGVRRTLPKDTTTLEPRVAGDEGDTDKSWHAIHYLLTGTASGGSFPTNFIMDGGQQVGDEEVGYGPARIFSPLEVAEIYAALTKHTMESLKARYNGEAMDKAEVYPQIWGRKNEDNFEYAWENFVSMREFIHSVSQTDNYLMLYLT